MNQLPLTDKLRIDKWLWAARFHKTRGLAAQEIDRGRVKVNGQPCKPARELKAGDRVEIRQEAVWRVVEVLALSAIRGPAPLAQTLYAETAESLAERARSAEARRLAPEPALALEQGRPTKRQRRDWQRWSASIDDD